MITSGLKAVDKGANPVLMREGIEKAAAAVAKQLLSQSHQVTTNDDVKNIATISSGSEEIGRMTSRTKGFRKERKASKKLTLPPPRRPVFLKSTG